MDWQQLIALLIVGLTACIFVLARARPRRFSAARDTPCGCGATESLGAKQSIRFTARKGERPRILVKNG